MSVTKWQTDRSQINHNWLQNVVLVGLRHAQEIVSGRIRSHGIRRSLTEDVLRWAERRQEIPQLFSRFEDEMSSKVYFADPPLSRCSAETKLWLIPVSHNMWLAREKVSDKVQAGLLAYDATAQSYDDVVAALAAMPETASTEDLIVFGVSLSAFAEACESLSMTVSALPRCISCC